MPLGSEVLPQLVCGAPEHQRARPGRRADDDHLAGLRPLSQGPKGLGSSAAALRKNRSRDGGAKSHPVIFSPASPGRTPSLSLYNRGLSVASPVTQIIIILTLARENEFGILDFTTLRGIDVTTSEQLLRASCEQVERSAGCRCHST